MKGIVVHDDDSVSILLSIEMNKHTIVIESDSYDNNPSNKRFSKSPNRINVLNEAIIKVLYKDLDVSSKIFGKKNNRIDNEYNAKNMQYALEYCKNSELYSNIKEF